MSSNSNVTNPSGKNDTSAVKPHSSKGKTKAGEAKYPEAEDDEGGEEDEEMEASGDEDEDDDEEEDLDEIDPTAIVGRRTRGVRVDYTSKEALEKAGLKGDEDEDEDEDAEMKEA